MAKYDHIIIEDEYIDMDISSTSHTREFEFQMSFNPLIEKETTTSPADELFYKGKLLPLHLPPRLQMVEKLLQNSTVTNALEKSTVSCHVSGELSQDESQTKKFWPKKLKLIKKASLTLKLKASKAYLKSLFSTKSSLKEEKNKNSMEDMMSVTTLMRSIERERRVEEECNYRKSFSGAINCDFIMNNSSCSSSSSSSFSSVHSNGMSTRSSSANSETEKSILGAIDYCKKSHISAARKSVSDIELFSISASRNQERPGLLCRG